MIVKENIANSLKAALQRSGKDAVRFDIVGFGWGGPEFGIVLDEQRENDTVFEKYGVKFVVDKEFDFLIEEVEVIETLHGFATLGDGAC